ncbi:MAG: O-antigen ligase family protein [Chloroflexi bacterium]|nr:O-antigen ligase family protein [Chloroflexota bacterium]
MNKQRFSIDLDIAPICQPALFYFALYIGLVGGNWILYHAALPVRIAHHIVLTVVLVRWLLKYGLPDTPMLMPLAALMVTVGLSGLNAIDRRMALEYSWHWFTNWLLFLYLIDALQRGHASTLFKAVFVGGVFLAASTILDWLISGGRPAGWFGVINLTGAYLAALILPALGWALVTGEPQHRRWLLGFAGAAGVAILLNQSRGPLLSLFVGLAVFGIVYIRSMLLKLTLSLALATGAFVVLLLMTLQPGHTAGDVVRKDLWSAGGDMLMEYPTGVGAGLFAQAYHERAMNEDRFTGAHNIYITLAAELGAPGLAAGAGFALTALYILIGRQRSLKQNAVLAALIGVLTQQVFDNYPAQNWTFLISLYAAYLLYEERWLNRRIPGTLNRLMVYGLVVYGLLFINWDAAQIHYENALRFQSAEQMELAIRLDSHNRLYKLQAARLSDPVPSDYALTNFARLSYSS